MKRPKFLTVWLTIMTLLNICIITGLFFVFFQDQASLGLSWENLIYSILGPIIELIALLLLWKWKKIGFYILVGSFIVIMMPGMIERANSSSYGLHPLTIFILGSFIYAILFLAIKPVWKKFK